MYFKVKRDSDTGMALELVRTQIVECNRRAKELVGEIGAIEYSLSANVMLLPSIVAVFPLITNA